MVASCGHACMQKITPELLNKAFSAKSTQHHRYFKKMRWVAASMVTDRHVNDYHTPRACAEG